MISRTEAGLRRERAGRRARAGPAVAGCAWPPWSRTRRCSVPRSRSSAARRACRRCARRWWRRCAPIALRRLVRATERGAAARILARGTVPAAGPVGPARPAQLKVRFGEPAVGLPYGSDWIRLDPGFLRRHIVTRSVPILGSVTCHRAMIAPLRAALRELPRRGLSRLVDPGDYAGCHAPRRIRPARPPLAARLGAGARPQRSANPPAAGRARTRGSCGPWSATASAGAATGRPPRPDALRVRG